MASEGFGPLADHVKHTTYFMHSSHLVHRVRPSTSMDSCIPSQSGSDDLSPKWKHDFLSEEPKIGDPSCEWMNFRKPKLRRFPISAAPLMWKKHLGTGSDGIVLKANTRDGEVVAVKIVRGSILLFKTSVLTLR